MISTFWLLWLHGVVTFFGYIAVLWLLAGFVAKLGYWAFIQIDRAILRFLETRKLFWATLETLKTEWKGR